jgi:hypothetical protein
MGTRKRILAGSVAALAATGIVAGSALSRWGPDTSNPTQGHAVLGMGNHESHQAILAFEYYTQGPSALVGPASEGGGPGTVWILDGPAASGINPDVSNPTGVEYANHVLPSAQYSDNE